MESINILVEPLEKFKEETGRNIGIVVTDEGEEWKKNRKIINHLLNPHIVQSYIPRISQIAFDWVKYLEGYPKVKFSKFMHLCSEFSFEAFSSVILGVRLGLFNGKPVIFLFW